MISKGASNGWTARNSGVRSKTVSTERASTPLLTANRSSGTSTFLARSSAGRPRTSIRDGTWYVERFEVPGTEVARFEAWSTKQMHELAALEGVGAGPSWAQYRDAPKRFPFDRYRSKGNRMISLELQAGADPMELSRDKQFVALLQGSVAEWDARLTYTRRDLTRNIVVRP